MCVGGGVRVVAFGLPWGGMGSSGRVMGWGRLQRLHQVIAHIQAPSSHALIWCLHRTRDLLYHTITLISALMNWEELQLALHLVMMHLTFSVHGLTYM